MRVFLALPLAALSLALAPSGGHAQVDLDSVRLRNDCRLARQVLIDGQPANKRGWALSIVPSCGEEGGDAVVAELRRFRSAAHPDVFEPVVRTATRYRDRLIFEGVLGLAADPAASVAARVQAIRILSAQLAPGSGAVWVSYSYFAGTDDSPGFVEIGPMSVSSDDPVFPGRPLPADALDRSEQAMRGLAENPGTPMPVRHAASVILDEIRGHRECAGLSDAECMDRTDDPR